MKGAAGGGGGGGGGGGVRARGKEDTLESWASEYVIINNTCVVACKK